MIFFCKTESDKLRTAWFMKKCLIRHTGHTRLFQDKHGLLLTCTSGKMRDIRKNIVGPLWDGQCNHVFWKINHRVLYSTQVLIQGSPSPHPSAKEQAHTHRSDHYDSRSSAPTLHG